MKLRSVWHFSRVTFFIFDCALLWAAVVAALKLSPRYPREVLDGIWLRPGLELIGYGLPVAMALGLQLAGMQVTRAGFQLAEAFTRTLFGLAGGMLFFVLIHILVTYSLIGRYVLGLSLIVGLCAILLSRLLVWKLADRSRRSVLVYGEAYANNELAQVIQENRLPIRVIGHTRLDYTTANSSVHEQVVIGALGLVGMAEKQGVDDIVVEVPDRLEPEEREALLQCTGRGINVVDMGYFYERHFERVYIPSLRESWFWGYDPTQAHPVYFTFKRITDVVLSIGGLFAFLPLAPIVVLLIKLQDGGPVIYHQVRTGLYNQPFKIYKFRSMRQDAEKDGAKWAAPGDSRVTLLGRLLRKTRIDEVPQFWNILRGDMSLIGPRPERPELVDVIEKTVPYYRYRHLIKPGLSGWAQINYRYGASVEDSAKKLSYDLFYMKYASARLDMLICLRTVVAMVKGAR